jgi:RNA polymerase sigma factor (sigma-70 family)
VSNRYKIRKFKILENLKSMSDDELILKLCKSAESKEQGYRLLMSKHQDGLYRHIFSILKEHNSSNDVLQNTFIKAFKYIDAFESRAGLATWLYRIAVNESLNHIRSERRHRHMEISDKQMGLPADENLDEEKRGEQLLKLAEARELLPERQKEVFALRFDDGMSYQEMSDHLNTSVGSLKASFHHALKKIEAHIKT